MSTASSNANDDSQQDEATPPEFFMCCISQDIMTDPVITPHGNTFERAAIEAWLQSSQQCPLTRKPLSRHQLIPNRSLRDGIRQWLQQNRPSALAAASRAPSSDATSASASAAAAASSSAKNGDADECPEGVTPCRYAQFCRQRTDAVHCMQFWHPRDWLAHSSAAQSNTAAAFASGGVDDDEEDDHYNDDDDDDEDDDDDDDDDEDDDPAADRAYNTGRETCPPGVIPCRNGRHCMHVRDRMHLMQFWHPRASLLLAAADASSGSSSSASSHNASPANPIAARGQLQAVSDSSDDSSNSDEDDDEPDEAKNDDEASSTAPTTLRNMVVAITGTLLHPRKYYQRLIAQHSGTFSARMTGAVTHLVAADPSKSTVKLDAARRKGTTIVGESFFDNLPTTGGGSAGSSASARVRSSKAAPSSQSQKRKFDASSSSSSAAAAGATVSGGNAKAAKRVVDIWNDDLDDPDVDVAASIAAAVNPAQPEPLLSMEEGDSIEVQGSRGSVYEIRLRGGVHYCTCPAWRNQRGGPVRSCKHLRATLGDAFESWRIRNAPGAAPPPPPRSSSSSSNNSGGSRGGGSSAGAGGARALPASGNPPPLMLAHKWDEGSHDPTGWWISEKYDGLRAFWDGSKFLSRAGNEFCAPDFFVKDLPSDHTLDGELFLGRKQFNETTSIVRTQDFHDQRWTQLKFMVFDIPSLGHKPFEERVAFLQQNFAGCQYVNVVKHTQAKSKADVLQQRDSIVTADAEGLMLRRPKSKYTGNRTKDLLKVKVWHDDEAVVYGYADGKGRHAGRVGALLCKLPNGRKFRVGTGLSDALRDDPPAVGTVITFKYQELTQGGVPRFPSFLRIAPRQQWPPPAS